MRKIFLIFGFIVLLLISIILIKTFLFTSKQIKVDKISEIKINEEQTVEHLSKSIQFKTVSYQDSSKIDNNEFINLHNYLEKIFPNVHSILRKEIIGDYSLLYTWSGQNLDLKPVLLMGHIDVVPVQAETEEKWKYSPFEGKVADGYIWGRGTMDDKVSVMGILEAVEILIAQKFQPKRTIYFAFGHDEEIGGKNGALKISNYLKSKNIELEYVLDEGGSITNGIVPGVSLPVSVIGIAEKGYVSLELSIESEGGHSSMPPPHTAVGILSTAIHDLERNPFSAEIRGATKQLFEYVAPEMNFGMKMIFANFWIFGPIIESQLASKSSTNATIRTTIAVTMFKGSDKENVLPVKATAVVNFRTLPGDNVDIVIEHVKKVINDSRIKIRVLGDVNEASNESDINSASFMVLQKTIREVFQEVVIAPYLVLGATDARYYSKLSKNIYRFVPQKVNSNDLDRIHGIDERISVENYIEIVKFYIQLIKNSENI